MKRIYLLSSVAVVLAIAGWFLRESTPSVGSSANSATSAPAKPNPRGGPTELGGGTGESKIIVQAPTELNTRPIGSNAGGAAAEPAPPTRETLSPDQTRMGELMSRRNFSRLIAETANSDDAQLNALSLLLVDFCMAHTSARAKTLAEAGGPPPNSLRAKPASTGDGLRADASGSRRLENARVITESCKEFNEGSGQSYADAALTRLNAKGSNAGLVFSELSPQLDYKALTPRQFSVIADALNEKNLGLLELLGAQIAPALNSAAAGSGASEGAAGSLAWQLALCQLGAYCGRDSLPVREACWRYGACAGDDLSSAVRAAMVRDGLTSTALDKQVSLIVKAINTHDPELLGIGRK